MTLEVRPLPHYGAHAFALWPADSHAVLPQYVVHGSVEDHRMDFVVARVSCDADDWTEEAPTYLTKRCFSGHVKWDGCSNWDLGSLHGCDRDDLVGVGEVMAACWDATSKALPTWRIG